MIAYYIWQVWEDWVKTQMQKQHSKHNACARNAITDYSMEPP